MTEERQGDLHDHALTISNGDKISTALRTLTTAKSRIKSVRRTSKVKRISTTKEGYVNNPNYLPMDISHSWLLKSKIAPRKRLTGQVTVSKDKKNLQPPLNPRELSLLRKDDKVKSPATPYYQ